MGSDSTWPGRQSLVYVMIDSKEEPRTGLGGRFQFNCFFWLSWLGVQGMLLLDRVHAGYMRDLASGMNGRMKERAETAPLLEYRLE